MTIKSKREIFRHKYYIVRRKNNKVLSRRHWSQKKARQFTKRQKALSAKESFFVSKSNSLNERYIIDQAQLSRSTGISEIQSKSAFYRREGVLQMTFLFKKGRSISQAATSRSNKMYVSSNKREMYHQCYKRAMGQINFSPDSVEIIDLRYIYWIKNAGHKLSRARKRR